MYIRSMRIKKIVFLFIGFSIAIPIYNQSLAPGFILEKVAEGLNPTTFTFGPQERIYIADKSGKVWIIDEQDRMLSNPMISIPVDDFDERGLGGIAFHPRFEDFPYLYLYYTVKGANHNRLSRFIVNGDQAVPNSEEILIDFDLVNGFIHNAGRLKFDQNEYLFVTTGDGAEQWNAQSLDNLLGKVLRFYPDGSIPEENPFFNSLTGNNRSIYAYGFRNPFSMDIHRITGEIYVGEVGLGTWEEVNRILPGMNYGWPWIEGFRAGQQIPENYIEPQFVYHHDVGCAVLGVSVLDEPKTNYPATYLNGVFYTDYCKGFIHYLDQHADHNHEFASGFELPVDLQFGPDGNLYVLTRKGKGLDATQDNTRVEDGVLWRIIYQGEGPPKIAQQPLSPRIPEGEPFLLDVNALGTPPLRFDWYQNGSLLISQTDSELQIDQNLPAGAEDSFYCIVSNRFGADTSDVVIPQVIGGHAPQAIILNPINQKYTAGKTIAFSGMGIDQEDDTLSPQQLTWTINFHHNEHYHPSIGPVNGIFGSSFVPPVTAETDTQVWYRINLTATDSDGLSNTVFQDVLPQKQKVALLGPEGIPVNMDGLIIPLPASVATVNGILRTIQAPVSHVIRDTFFLFDHWKGKSNSNIIVKSFRSDESLEVVYHSIPLGTGSGLLGSYYGSISNVPSEPLQQRVDSVIDFVWEDNPNVKGIPKDRFMVVWTGYIEPILSGSYTIKTFTDDGLRLWIKDSLIIDAWKSRRSTQDRAQVALQRGNRYPIILQYFEDLSQAVVQLHWSHQHIPSQIIPTHQLYPVEWQLPGKLIVFPFHDLNADQTYDSNEPILDQGEITVKTDFQETRVFSMNGKEATSWVQPGVYRIQAKASNYFLEAGHPKPGDPFSVQISSMDSTILWIPFQEKPKQATLQGVDLSITPNPVAQSFYIHYQTLLGASSTLRMYNNNGQMIRRKQFYLEPGFGSLREETSNLSSGVYVVEIEVLGQSQVFKITKR